MKLPELKIGNLVAKYPVIQAGMGVRIAAGNLAGSVINAGGMGVIASVGLGNYDAAEGRNYADESAYQLVEEIREARRVSGGKGPLGVNVMVALTNYEQLVRAAVKEGVEFIISGAGLPLRLPGFVKPETVLIPVVSSARALALILKTWKRKFDRVPDAVVVEGPLCGGHLGFNQEQIDNPDSVPISAIYKEVKELLDEKGIDIPLIAAEGVVDKADIESMLSYGFQGVQIGTRFICMEESGMHRKGQDVYLKATKDDVVTVKSPVGMPVRVLKTPLVNRMLEGKKEPIRCAYRCLLTCDKKTVPFCIAKALLLAKDGDIENGLFMTGCAVDRVNDILSVKDFFASLD